MTNPIIQKLNSGLTVIVNQMPHTQTVFCGVWAKTGSINETPELAGVSHFLEHMAFKGTKSRTYTQIAETIEDIGGEINAYTSKETTLYYTKSLAEHFPTALELLSDIIQNSVYDPSETEKERTVILQELLASLDDPDDVVYEMFDKAAFGDNSFGRPIIGSRDTIKNIGPEQLKSYIKAHYTAENLIILVSGNIDPANAIKLTDELFHLPSAAPMLAPKGGYVGGQDLQHKDLEQTRYMLGFNSAPSTDRFSTYSEILLSSVFGGGMSSRLFQEVREKQNLVYSIHSSRMSIQSAASFYIHASSEPSLIDKVVKTIDEEIEKIKEGVSAQELNRAKASLKFSLASVSESVSVISRLYAQQIQIHGQTFSIADDLKLVDSIGLNDIKDAAARIFSTSRTTAMLGKF